MLLNDYVDGTGLGTLHPMLPLTEVSNLEESFRHLLQPSRNLRRCPNLQW